MVAALKPGVAVLSQGSVRYALLLVAVIPLAVGVQLPALTQPRLTTHAPTLFPSGDGHYPMGAYVAFLHALRHGNANPIDHNQRVWRAVREARFDVGPDQRVKVLYTPMYGYFMLEGARRGFQVDWASQTMWTDTNFYADSRTLSRHDVKFALHAQEELMTRNMMPVSPEMDGISVLHVGSGDAQWAARARLLNRLFSGNEYRIGPSESAAPAGRLIFWFSDQPFGDATRDAKTGWYYSQTPITGEHIQAAWSALPAWMSVQRFSGN